MESLVFRTLVVFGVVFLVAAGELHAAAEEGFTLPDRPLPLTRAQYEALQKIAQQPPHAAINHVRATYRDKSTQFATDASQVATLAGLGGGLLLILISAAPL